MKRKITRLQFLAETGVAAVWRQTAPIDGPLWGFWPTGSAWLCTHLWHHYEFTGDGNFLARAYPVMKSAAEFFLDTLVQEPKHNWLVTCPSISPENKHPGEVCDLRWTNDGYADHSRSIQSMRPVSGDSG